MPRFALVLPLLVALAACGGNDEAASADELTTTQDVTDAMLAGFEANVGAVDGFTVVAGGAEGRYTVSDDTSSMDRVTLQVVPASLMQPPSPSAQLLYSHVPNVARLAQGLRGATFDGRATRDGRPVYVLATGDPTAMLGGGAPAMDGTRELRLYVDPETFDVLEIYQSFEADTTAFTTRLIYSDFREADGLRLPYRVRQVTTGLNQAIPQNERIAIGGQIGLALRQAEQMPMGPEREARTQELEAELRRVSEGIDETELQIESVRVGVPEPVPAPPPGAAGPQPLPSGPTP